MAAAIKFAEDLGTEVIDIIVGPERKRYVVHKSPLTAQSEYFHNAFRGDFKEAYENSIHLKEEDPVAVALMIGFVYRGVIPGTEKKISPFSQSYFTTSQEESTIPNAELINGSSYPFSTTSLAEESSILAVRNQFHSLCVQPQYSMFSQEELRLADYKVGRKYSDSFIRVRGGIFGHPPGYATPTGGRLYGDPPRPGIFGPFSHQHITGAPPSQSTSLFGTPQPIQSPQTRGVSSSSSLFGTPQPTQSLQTQGVPTSSALYNNLFGPPQPGHPQQGANVSGTEPSSSQNTQTGASGQPPQTHTLALGFSAAMRTSQAPFAHNFVPFETSVQIPATATAPANAQLDSSDPPPENGDTNASTIPTAERQISTAFTAHVRGGSIPFGVAPPSASQAGSLFGTPRSATSQAQSPAPATARLFENSAPSAALQTHQRQPDWTHAAPPAVGAHLSGGLFGTLPPGPLFASTWGRGTQNISSPVVPPENDSPKGPGSFGWSSTIDYPKSSGVFITGIPRSKPLDVNITENQGQQLALVKLCLFAETILWPSLFNAAIESYVRGELNLHRPIPAEHVTLIYDRTHSESTLRAYVLESMCRNRGDSLMYIDLARKYDELMEDILNKLPELRNTTTAPLSPDDLIRSFHMADLRMPENGKGKGKGKEKGDVDISGVFPKDSGDASTSMPRSEFTFR